MQPWHVSTYVRVSVDHYDTLHAAEFPTSTAHTLQGDANTCVYINMYESLSQYAYQPSCLIQNLKVGQNL